MTAPRPTKLTDAMKNEVARDICAALIEDGIFPEGEASEKTSDLLAVMSTGMDGYRMARKLDDERGWFIDLSIIETLEGCSSMLDEKLIEAQRDWVLNEGIQPAFTEGQSVVLKSGETGVIDGISKFRPACYEVKMDGDPDADGPMQSRRICRFEDVVIAPSPSL